VIDCEDLPLNVSRELLQKNPMLTAISSAVTKRILNELTRKADKDTEAYNAFWENFGAVLKEGLYGAPNEHKQTLLDLVRFKSTTRDGLVSLKQYVEAMKDGQEHIYYITGESQDAIRNSPHLEGFAAKGIEVLLLSDPIDDFWIPSLFEGYAEKQFQSVTRGGADLDKVKDADDKDDAEKDETKDEDKAKTDVAPLVASIKIALGETVKDVRESARLTDSACCLVADDGDLDMNLERILRQHQQVKEAAPRVLEINPKHPLIKGLSERVKAGKTGQDLDDAAYLLLDQARIMDGETVTDPKAFARRMSKVMEMGLVS
jgi:molecular chaperone HtpG